MVNKEVISKSIDDAINKSNETIDGKCTFTLKAIRKSIHGIVENITENKYEYDLLMKYIPRFYRDYYNKSYESVFALDFYGNEYSNDGNRSNVHLPDDAKQIGEEVGLMIDMHNHPSGCCFQSAQDFRVTGLYNEKYAITVAKDGVMIVRYHSPTDLDNEKHGTELAYGASSALFPLQKRVQESVEYREILGKYYNDESISQLDMINQTSKLVTDEIINSRDKLMEDVVNGIGKYGYDVTIEYVPVIRN